VREARSTRRNFVKTATIASVGLAGVGALSPARLLAATGGDGSSDFFGRDHVVGRVRRVDSGTAAIIQAADGSGFVALRLEPAADVLRGVGDSVDFTNFKVGETLFAGGNRSGGEMAVTHVRSMFRLVQGTVGTRSGSTLRVDSQDYVLPGPVANRTNERLFAPGTQVAAEVWDAPEYEVPVVVALVAQ
jgi:hypothetical protein